MKLEEAEDFSWRDFVELVFADQVYWRAYIAQQIDCQPEEEVFYQDGDRREIYIPSKTTPGELTRIVFVDE